MSVGAKLAVGLLGSFVHMRSPLAKRRREWDDVAALDPFWAVLTDPGGKRGAWDRSAFFDSGEAVVEDLLGVARQFQVPAQFGTALDFGCGLGRLTRALSKRFATVYGVDVSGGLLEQAEELNRDLTNCEFRQLQQDGLAPFESQSIDLVCSFLVLQHQARESAIDAYIAEFVRLLRPGGLAVFQIPTHIPLRNRFQPRRRVYAGLRSLGVPPSTLYNRLGLDPLRMRHKSRDNVLKAISLADGELLAALDDDRKAAFASSTYYVARSETMAPQHRD
jgi:SAM-dependent methyltransferase